MIRIVVLLGVAVAMGGEALGAAAVEGKVTLPATRPPAVGQRYQGKVALGPPEPPAAIVYLEGNFPTTITNVVVVGQKNFQFTPGVIAVQKGSMVKFPNMDDDYHNVFSLSKSKRFDLGRYRKEEEPASQMFNQVGVVKLFCDIHEHMRGAILVLDTPHFTKTDATGRYSLTNLPAGSYKLKAWLDEKVVWEKAVELKDGETATVDFTGK